MRSAEQFKAMPQFALLLFGPPFSGKTNIIFQFPDLYVLDADDKLVSAVNRHPNKKDFWYDCPLRDGNNNPVPDELRWDMSTAYLKLATADPRIRTIAIDSGTAIGHFLINHILRFPSTAKTPIMVGNIKAMDISQWNPYKDIWTKLIMGLRATGKMIIVVMHDTADKDETTGAINWYPSFQGQLQRTGAGLFTDVWHTETRSAVDKNTGQIITEYYVRTAPRPNMALGTTLGLPAEFTFTWQELAKRLELTPSAPPSNAQVAPLSK